ncbi:tetratricopeptide repeat protein [Flaviaesturariibacter amylovorans]|uniref:Tetratricopeptide repeat protein n=1 Tax=Flaviaesturariibacter amylovorans TaxID=1084520 RepID=A0ABP8GZE8_9BACT
MKQLWFLGAWFLLPHFASAQASFVFRNPDARFLAAKEFYQKGQYNLAAPLFKELRAGLRETDRINRAMDAQEIDYYAISTALMQGETAAATDALQYINVTKNNARVQMMHFQLAEFYFRRQEFSEALTHYEAAGTGNISEEELSAAQFHQGYAYFTQKQFAQAKPLFNAVRQKKGDPNQMDAQYYYGFIAFTDRNYREALDAFRAVENHPTYEGMVPYYIAQIYYVQGQKDQAVRYAEEKLKAGKAQHYDLELKQLLGHAYFERKEYAKALPYLEDYVNRSTKVRREDLYELSYSYYQANNHTKAIEGFRQLSGKEDSLSQHAMYLLGDSYLKTGQKANARNAFLFSAANNSNAEQREIARFNYAKLSYELGYQDEALKSLRSFLNDYPSSTYAPEATELLVGALANTNNYRDALTLIEGLRNPTAATRRFYPRILYGRATEMINDGRLEEAEALIDRALKDPNNTSVLPWLQFWKGELAYRDDRLDEAIRYYQLYLTTGAPASGEANARTVNYNLGYAYLRKENYTVARGYFEPLARSVAINSDPLTQDAYLRAADTWFMGRSYAQARTMYDNVIRFSWPAEDYATYQKAIIAGITNANEKVTLLNTLVRKFPNSALVDDANMEIANTLLAAERFREAIPYLSTLTKATDNNTLKPQAFLKLGIAHQNSNNDAEAIASYNVILTRYPNSEEADDALENLRTIYVEQGRAGEYADVARKAGKPLSVSAEDSLTYASAEIQLQNGNTAAAQTALEQYLQKFATGTYALDAHFHLGDILFTKKDTTGALPHFELLAERAPNKWAERSALTAARIYFFGQRNYAQAERYFTQLKGLTGSQEIRLEAMRGLLRSQYQQQKWTEAAANARELVALKGSTTDDKALSNMVLGRSAQLAGQFNEAITAFRAVIAVNKAALAAEARYEIAASLLAQEKLKDAEKAAFEVISKSGSYELWVTCAYILLGDIYYRQKDFFNAKATYQSVVENATQPDLKAEAQRKLDEVTAEEARTSKVGQ